MSLKVYGEAVEPYYDQLLPGLSGAARWALWVRPAELRFTTEEAAVLLSAFVDFNCLLWHRSSSSAQTPRVREHMRVFGRWPALAKGVLAEETLKYRQNGQTILSDVCAVSVDAAADLALFLSRSTVGSDSALSFVRKDEECIRMWVLVTSRLSVLWDWRSRYLSRAPVPVDGNAALLEYATATISLSGIVGLFWSAEAELGLLLLGDEEALQTRAALLSPACATFDRETFEAWFRRGLSLCAYP